MKLSEWARKMGISYRRAWQMFKDGKLPIGTILEDEPRGVVLENTVAIYSRASGHEDKDDLERQAERLKEYVLAKGYKIIHVVKEVGSGVKDTRPKLIELLRKKDYRILLVGHKDRLTRFGFNYIILKFVSWSISLGSGTSGGTLAPLFIIGGSCGAALGSGILLVFPHFELDVRLAGLIGMAAMFAGASRAFFTSVVFALETTFQPFGLLPLLGGCAAAYLISGLLMKHSIMTEKIVRRGVHVPTEYFADFFEQTLVRDSMSNQVVTLKGGMTLHEVRLWITSGAPGSSHKGFPVLDEQGNLIGVVTQRDLFDTNEPVTKRIEEIIKRPPAVVYEDSTLREAVDLMAEEGIGRLPVVTRTNPLKVIGIITRSDILSAQRKCLEEARQVRQSIRWLGVR